MAAHHERDIRWDRRTVRRRGQKPAGTGAGRVDRREHVRGNSCEGAQLLILFPALDTEQHSAAGQRRVCALLSGHAKDQVLGHAEPGIGLRPGLRRILPVPLELAGRAPWRQVKPGTAEEPQRVQSLLPAYGLKLSAPVEPGDRRGERLS
jgi:hypothetical protein